MLALDRSQFCSIRPKSEVLSTKDSFLDPEKISDKIIDIFYDSA